MALIKCPECNKEISDTIDKCIHCGAMLCQEQGSIKTKTKKSSTKKVIITVIFIAIAILAIIVIYALFSATEVLQLTANDGTVYQVNLSNLDKGVRELCKEWSIENKYGIVYRGGSFAQECLVATSKNDNYFYVHCINLENGNVEYLGVYEDRSLGVEYALNEGAISMTYDYYIENLQIITYGVPIPRLVEGE